MGRFLKNKRPNMKEKYMHFNKIALCVIALNTGTWAAESESLVPTIDELYKSAITLRNLQTSESLAQAADIFLSLADQGHKNAAHNYASLQYKAGNFDAAAEYFYKAGLPASKNNYIQMRKANQTKDLYLVVGSMAYAC
jgi:glutaminase